MPTHTPEQIHQRRWWILAVLCLSLLIVFVGNSSLNVTIPTLSRELGATESQLQWLVAIYSLVFAGLLFTTGALGDRFGRKGALQLGLVIFLAGAGLAASSNGMPELIACRAIMGVGAAFIMPSTLSILINVFPPHERNKAIAIWASITGAAGGFGPVISGLLLAHFWWGSVFLINVPLLILALAAGYFLVPTSRDPEKAPLDPVGAVLSTIGIVSVVYGLIQAPDNGWGSPTTLGAFALGAVMLVSFGLWERRQAEPMLDIGYFRNPAFSTGTGGMVLVFMAMYGVMFLITQYFQLVLNYTALSAALRLMPLALIMLIVAPLTPRIIAAFGANRTVAVGMALVALGLLLFRGLTPHTAYWFVVVAITPLTTGIAMTMAPMTAAIMSAVPPRRAGVGLGHERRHPRAGCRPGHRRARQRGRVALRQRPEPRHQPPHSRPAVRLEGLAGGSPADGGHPAPGRRQGPDRGGQPRLRRRHPPGGDRRGDHGADRRRLRPAVAAPPTGPPGRHARGRGVPRGHRRAGAGRRLPHHRRRARPRQRRAGPRARRPRRTGGDRRAEGIGSRGFAAHRSAARWCGPNRRPSGERTSLPRAAVAWWTPPRDRSRAATTDDQPDLPPPARPRLAAGLAGGRDRAVPAGRGLRELVDLVVDGHDRGAGAPPPRPPTRPTAARSRARPPPSSGQAKTDVAASLTKVTTRKDNCIDNVQFDFSPGVPAWSVGYQTGPFTDKTGKAVTPPGTYYLVIEFQGVSASYAGPTSVSDSSLNYVKQVTEAAGANGSDEWVISLDQKLQYTTSVSATPAYFVLGLG